MTCLVCGKPEPGPLPANAIAAIAGPKIRTTLDGFQEPLCARCQTWAALAGKIIAPSRPDVTRYTTSIKNGAGWLDPNKGYGGAW